VRALGILTLAVLLGACGGAAPPPSSTPSAAPATPSPGAGSAGSQPTGPITNRTWLTVADNPGQYLGAPVDLTGQVINVEQDATRTGIQLWTDPLRAAGNTVVTFPRAGFPEIHVGDQVEVEGTLASVFTGKNDAGTVLNLPKVEASIVSVTARASATPAPAPAASAPAVPARPSPSSSATPAPTAAPQPIGPGPFRVSGTGASGLSVREGPSAGARRLGFVHDGDVVQVVAQAAPGWAQIRGSGFSGYAAREYLSGPVQPANQTLGKLQPK
jgi:hypothetical protein